MKSSVRSPVRANNVTSPRHNDAKSHVTGNDGVFANTREINNKNTGFENNNNNSIDNINPSSSGSSSNNYIKSNIRNNNNNSNSGRRSLSSDENRGPSTEKGSNTLLIGDSVMRGIKKRGLNHNVDIITLPGRTSEDIFGKLRSMDISPYSKIVVYAGGNDISNGRHISEI